jgi:catechol 2,3-dioxygenase-like lactoylglutathione lyase family enzyme
MLSDYPAVPVLAVTDLDRARAFYEGTLGFVPDGDVAEGVVYRSGGGTFLVYPSAYAGTNRATAMSFAVPGDSFDAEVAALRAADAEFQTFEMEGLEWHDGVGTSGPMRAVWFPDPDGNILNLETTG